VLKYHPDKKKEGDDFDDEMFKTVQIGKAKSRSLSKNIAI